MMPIKQLDPSLANKIAAGEVVERPLSVIKELAENAVDAGANAITIEIREGGTALIRVADNGHGIPPEDVETAFMQFATSKLTAIEDLYAILTLGFRGEALPSIASVSQLEMRTKPADAPGTLIELHGGKIITKEETACKDGTAISVKNLFYNTPARLKFLKKPPVETGLITEFVQRLALGYPGVAFRYIRDGQLALQTGGKGDLRTAVYQVYGGEFAKGLVAVGTRRAMSGPAERDVFSDTARRVPTLSGYIGKKEIARGSRGAQHFFLNGRFIKSELLRRAVEEAYQTMLPIGRFPVFILRLDIDPAQVDVNVHPQKLEVRFAEEGAIYKFVRDRVLETLLPERRAQESGGLCHVRESACENTDMARHVPTESPAPIDDLVELVDFAEEAPAPQKFQSVSVANQLKFPGAVSRANAAAAAIPDNPYSPVQLLAAEEDSSVTEKNFEYLGQVFGTYCLVFCGNELLILDQHAAHERILYEEILDNLGSRFHSQKLLSPVEIPLSPAELALVQENLHIFAELGFELTVTERAAEITTLPTVCKNMDSRFFEEILRAMGRGSSSGGSEYIREQVAMAACKRAIKANDSISEPEVRRLLARLLEARNPGTCPHGRPTFLRYGKRELERLFGRT